jgi:hypothetical protein
MTSNASATVLSVEADETNVNFGRAAQTTASTNKMIHPTASQVV